MGDGRIAEFEAERPWLLGIAYRMLGEVQEAEDTVQDAYLRWTAADRTDIDSPRAWLTKAVTNLCLNRLDSARARRETYVGPWLPEPVLAGPVLGPLETVEQRDTVSVAMLTLMERLTPAERAVFVLREAFGYPHHEIAEMLDVTDAASRQLHTRARRHLSARDRHRAADPGATRKLVERFLEAAFQGDLAGLTELLAEDVVAYGDGGGKATAGRRPIVGPQKVARLCLGLAGNQAAGVEMTIEDVNGGVGLVGRIDGVVLGIAAVEVSDGLITGLYNVVNPDKLPN